ncbi:MAG: response regulator, partial [Nitrospirales bacterium]|nr:response regulator [Nitrospirales bacterium]
MKERLLIVDDSDEIRMQLKWGLDKEYSLLMAANPSEALSLFRRHRPSVVTLDLGLPPHEEGTEEGFRCLGEILKENLFTKVIVITGNEDRENALKAIQSGAYDYYKKPIDLSELVVIVRRAFHLSGLETENRRLHGELQGRGPEFLGMVGSCPQ